VHTPPYVKPFLYLHSHLGKPRYLLHEDLRVYDDAVSNKAPDVVMEDAGRHLMEDDLLTVVIEGVAGIRPTLEARHDLIPLCQCIYDFSFPLVSPLKP